MPRPARLPFAPPIAAASTVATVAAAISFGAAGAGPAGAGALDPARFVEGALTDGASTVECTLSGGTETTCHRLSIAGVPADSPVGPFCPPNVMSTAAEGGIWLDGGGVVHDVDGAFIVALPELYDDDAWALYDPDTGEVNVTDTLEACEAAARPDVDPAYRNHCVECSLDYVGGGVPRTYLIPVEPVPADAPGRIGPTVGVALNGAQLAAPAPVADILANYTIAAFDDCGGHVNPVDGYHYHAATGCTESAFEDDGHAGLIGYALDGHGIYGLRDADGLEPDGLDECRGQTDEARGYHYHAASAGENLFIGCFRGETGGVEGVEGVEGDEDDRGGPGGPGGHPPAGG